MMIFLDRYVFKSVLIMTEITLLVEACRALLLFYISALWLKVHAYINKSMFNPKILNLRHYKI